VGRGLDFGLVCLGCWVVHARLHPANGCRKPPGRASSGVAVNIILF
jgi:hypothetical protein